METMREAEAYISGITKFVKKNDLGHTKECLRRLGDPDKAFPSVHVAGTNGKGSTCAFLERSLRESGRKTGLFTSPHLISINERFAVDGEMISDDVFLENYEKVKAVSVKMTEEGLQHPSYFEFLFLMGMCIFRDAGIDVAVLETGLGGRFDATNAVDAPVVSVITSMGMDHMQYLGSTLAEIAGEKAGIIKTGTPLVYDDRKPEAAEVIRKTAEEKGVPYLALSDAGAEVLHAGEDGIDFTVGIPAFAGMTFHLPFAAPYQVWNASLALLALTMLPPHLAVDGETAAAALAKTQWVGRMQKVGERTYIDGAHNEDGVTGFTAAAAAIAGGENVTLLFGAMADKDFSTMIGMLVKRLAPVRVIVTKADEYRGEDPEVLAAQFREAGAPMVEAVASPEEAWERAKALRGDGYLFGAGSLYLIGRILRTV